MSIATRRHTCAYCDGPRDQGVSYCSKECKIKHKGQKALNAISDDHKFCGTCYKPLKTVYRPPDNESPKLRGKAVIIRDAFVGFEEWTKHAKHGSYGLECECGNVDHYHAEELLRDGEPYEWFLSLAFRHLQDKDRLSASFDMEAFADVYWRTKDFDLAVGKGLYG